MHTLTMRLFTFVVCFALYALPVLFFGCSSTDSTTGLGSAAAGAGAASAAGNGGSGGNETGGMGGSGSGPVHPSDDKCPDGGVFPDCFSSSASSSSASSSSSSSSSSTSSSSSSSGQAANPCDCSQKGSLDSCGEDTLGNCWKSDNMSSPVLACWYWCIDNGGQLVAFNSCPNPCELQLGMDTKDPYP